MESSYSSQQSLRPLSPKNMPLSLVKITTVDPAAPRSFSSASTRPSTTSMPLTIR